MKTAKFLFSALLVLGSVSAPAVWAKDTKKSAKAMKECEEKGGTWDKKKKNCKMEAKATTPSEQAPSTSGDTAPSNEPAGEKPMPQ